MGSDMHMNPPPPPPIWEQVKALVDRNKEMAVTLREQKDTIIALQQECDAKDRVIARQAVQIQGQPFPGEEDHMSPDHPEYDDGTDAVLGLNWCTCGAKTPQPHGHNYDCPARRGT